MVTACPQCGYAAPAEPDGRNAQWRVRVRLFRDGMDKPEADSDPERPAGEVGDTVLRGLPAVAEHVQGLAWDFHQPIGTVRMVWVAPEGLKGLESSTLLHRLKSLRPTLSRNQGRAVWRVPYTVAGAEWRADVDVQRVNTGEST